MKGYENLKLMSPFLDSHFILSILDFLEECEGISKDATLKWRKAVLTGTKLFEEKKKHSLLDSSEKNDTKALENQLRDRSGSLLKLILGEIGNLEEIEKEQNFNFPHLNETFAVTESNVESMCSLAKILYEQGDYSLSSKLLSYHLKLEKNLNSKISSGFGKLAAGGFKLLLLKMKQMYLHL
eukprot:snap_masked-scaffold_22-processed-gene-2.19-mRNA-1 protein AED:0.01 eAED:0.01 QI:92/0.8/0.83/1/0.6/0.5/6/889/181